jgi:hypothetical protein
MRRAGRAGDLEQVPPEPGDPRSQWPPGRRLIVLRGSDEVRVDKGEPIELRPGVVVSLPGAAG